MALFATFAIAVPIHAGSVPITFSLSGTGTVVDATDTTLTLDTEATGSILSGNAALNTAWNPISYSELCVLDLTTNLLTGNFTITFQNGDTLRGADLEDDTVIDNSPTGTGAFPQTLTFTGGTGAFAGATGSVSGNGFLGTTNFTVSGTGTVNTAAAPEPGSAALLVIGGLALIGVNWRRSRPRMPSESQ